MPRTVINEHFHEATVDVVYTKGHGSRQLGVIANRDCGVEWVRMCLDIEAVPGREKPVIDGGRVGPEKVDVVDSILIVRRLRTSERRGVQSPASTTQSCS